MKRIALLTASVLVALSASAQISITTGSLTYTQNFDALDTSSTTASSNLPAGWSIYEVGTSAAADQMYKGDTGSSNAGETRSYGSLTSTERALGSLASGTNLPSYGAKFVNNTGLLITGFTVRYRGEQWRLGQAARATLDSLYFSHSTTATNVNDAVAVFTPNNALTFTSPNITGATAGALNGNAAGNNAILTATVSTSIAIGGTIVLKWTDPNITGSDDGLALDSFSITFTTTGFSPRPNIASFTPVAGATGVGLSTNLSITFDKNVTKGTGNISIKNRTTQTTQTIPVAASNVTIAGKVVTITGVNLQTASQYHVRFDSTAFDTAGFRSSGIYDSTIWRFSTIGLGIGRVGQTATLPVTVVNPAGNGAFTILATIPQAATLTAKVYDLSGREVAAQTFKAVKGDNRLKINTNLPAGAYIIRVDNGEFWGAVKATMQ